MHERELRSLHLAITALPPKLVGCLDDEEDPAHAGVVRAESSPVGVERKLPTQTDPAALDEASPLARLAEPDRLERRDHRDRERVVDRREIDVGHVHPGHPKCSIGRLLGRDLKKIGRADLLVSDGLTTPHEDHRGLREIACPLPARDDHGAAPVTDDAAIQQVKRIGDDPALHHVLNRDLLSHLRVRIQRCVTAHGHRDLGKLLRGRSVHLHVPSSNEGIASHRGQSVGGFEGTRRIESHAPAGSDRHGSGRGRAPVQDECDLAQSGVDGRRRVRDVGDEGRAADVRPVQVVGLQVQVLGERDDPHGAHVHSGREEAVDVGDPKPCVLERPARGLRHDLPRCLVGRPACRVLVHPCDRDLTGEAHASSPRNS